MIFIPIMLYYYVDGHFLRYRNLYRDNYQYVIIIINSTIIIITLINCLF